VITEEKLHISDYW